MASTTVGIDEEKLTASEIEQGQQYLDHTRTGVIGVTRGLTEAQWKFKPSADAWSIEEILEHMVVVQDRVLGPILQKLAESAAATNSDCEQVDAIVIHQFTDRRTKFKGPDFIMPTGQLPHAEALGRLLTNYKRLNDHLEEATGLRQHVAEAAPLKAITQGKHQFMDGYQWVLAAGAHTDRHTKQILEVKADPGFPLN
jgi:hypothetical protein